MKKQIYSLLSLILILNLVALTLAGGAIVINPGCKQFDSSGLCSSCSNRFYKDKDGICQPVSSTCKTYKTQNGACTSCYDGFMIIQDACLPQAQIDSLLGIYSAVANCNEIGDNGVCKKCSTGYYFDSQKVCKKVPDTCAKFDYQLTQCVGCYQGYSLNKNKQCQVSTQTVTDFGCSKFQQGKCVKCSIGYYFNNNKQCQIIPPTCQKFDDVSQQCTKCYPGYALDTNFKCIQSSPVSLDPGCARFDNGVCVRCSVGFYFNKSKLCRVIPATCSNFDTLNQKCMNCYNGYALNKDNVCVESNTQPLDLGCSRFENGVCTKCSFGFYFDRNGVCKLIPATCGQFNVQKQICISCYPGYVLDKSNVCVQSVLTGANLDPGCNSFGADGKCIKCSFGFYFDKNKNCRPVPPTCSKFDTHRQVCINCYPGFIIDDTGNCIQGSNQIIDLGCFKFQNGKCTKCSAGYYFNSDRVCRIIPPTCSKFDSVKLQCTLCYPGYSLDSFKNCILSPDAASTDLGCSRFLAGKCMQCSFGYFFNFQGKCQQIPASCANFDTMIGVCRNCYGGYELNLKNQCVVSNKDSGVTDPYCKQWKNSKCVSCSIGAYFDVTGKCQIADPLCRKFNMDLKKCDECYPGYSLDSVKNTCFQTPATDIDPNCKSFRNGKCQQCSFRFYKSPTDGKCKQIDSFCRLYSSVSGECSTCYDGYKYNSTTKKCETDTSAGVTDLSCAEWKNGKCSKCAYGAYFNVNGFCTFVNPLCMTWSQTNGECKSCYPSFDLINGQCIPSKKDNIDQNCNKFNAKGVCTQCSMGFYFSAANVCTQVDPLCSSFDSKFARCYTCYPGYKVSSAGKCIEDSQVLSDLNCAEFKNSVCTKCSLGFYFDASSLCKAINPFCRNFDTKLQKCNECYPGYVLFNNDCVIGSKNNLCAQWKQGICLRCVPRAYFNDEGGCAQVNQYCKDYDMFDGACTTCYGGFQLNNGNCTRGNDNNGCISYGADSSCQLCQRRKYLDKGACLKIDDFCDQFNFIKKSCNKCYKGYALNDNDKCIIAQIKTDSQIQNCHTYHMNGQCIECFDRFYLKNNTCNEVSIFCKKYDVNSGDCTDCYTGFKQEKGKCIRK